MRVKQLQKSVVLYDSQCKVCRRFRRIIEFLDTRHQLNFADLSEAVRFKVDVPEDLLHRSFHILNSDGRIESGSRAIPRLIGLSPVGSIASRTMLKIPIIIRLTGFAYDVLLRLHFSRKCEMSKVTDSSRKFQR